MALTSLSTTVPPLTLLHDPNSVRSEYALQALQLGNRQFDVRHVTFAGGHLSEDELRDLTFRLAGDRVDALVRRGRRYRALDLDLDGADAETVISTLVDHPELLATPILDDGMLAMIGNSTERAEAWAVTGHCADARPTFSIPALKVTREAA
ncbi:MAG: ArsC/Spx/MgsR family protein [Solirubrobacteraceae bacterium]|nr:ArsC/Spx/MgsR family protein [Patulibacter sp.]